MTVKKAAKKITTSDKGGAKNVAWDLSELYSSPADPRIKKDILKGLELCRKFNRDYCGKITSKGFTDSMMLSALVDYEKSLEAQARVMQYSHLVFSLDTSAAAAKALLAEAEEKAAEMDNLTLFFRLEICAVPENKIAAFLKSKKLAAYHHFLRFTRALKPYQLGEKEEQIINIKNLNGKNSVVKLYDELTASFRFKVKMEDGREQVLNCSQTRNLRYHPSHVIRKRSCESYFNKYSDNGLVISTLYNMILRDHAAENRIRGFKRADEPQNVSNELPNEVIDTLIEVTTKNVSLVHRYYALKAKLLKVKKLELCDVYAPTAKSAQKFTWDESKKIVLDNFKKFDQKFHDMAKKFFDNGWIDARLSDNKKSGAYCSSSVPSLHPYVFMNFAGTMRDVMTLAHELGHALHSLFSSKQTILNFHSILPLAETASVFCERIVSDNLFSMLRDKNEKIALLTGTLEDFFATSFRQNMFTRFEREAHAAAAKGVLSHGQLTEIYRKELGVMFGKSLSITDDFRVEWSVIPHIFHLPFYCYSYNFGLLLVLALYQKYCEEGEKFKSGFINLLSSGGSEAPDRMLGKIGIDISKPSFWQKGFEFMAAKINELEKLLK